MKSNLFNTFLVSSLILILNMNAFATHIRVQFYGEDGKIHTGTVISSHTQNGVEHYTIQPDSLGAEFSAPSKNFTIYGDYSDVIENNKLMAKLGEPEFKNISKTLAPAFKKCNISPILKNTVTQYSTEKDSCNFFETQVAVPSGNIEKQVPLLEGRLTPFWAQEYIGADLAREFLSQQKALVVPVIGQIDSLIEEKAIPKERFSTDFDHSSTHHDFIVNSKFIEPSHSTMVANLMFGNPPIGVSYNAKFGTAAAAGDDFVHAVNILQKKQHHLVNISMSLHDSEILFKQMEKLAQKSIVVNASGNGFTHPLDVNAERLNSQVNSKIVLIGSMSPVGFVSGFSNEGELIDILAPADAHVQSVSKIGKISTFAGTSAAAPLVTGALSNVVSFLPDLNANEAKQLLRKTAIPLLQTRQLPSKNGSGMLNAYQLVRVAERLRNLGWSSMPQSKRNQILENEKTYDFLQEATEDENNAKQELEKLLALSPDSSENSRNHCALLKKVFLLLRKSFLLNPAGNARQLLESLYRKQGLEINALFYQSLGPEVSKVVNAALKDHDQSIQASGIRALPFGLDQKNASEQAKEELATRTLQGPDSKVYDFTIADFMRDDLLEDLFHKDPTRAMFIAGIKMGQKGLDFFDKHLNTVDWARNNLFKDLPEDLAKRALKKAFEQERPDPFLVSMALQRQERYPEFALLAHKALENMKSLIQSPKILTNSKDFNYRNNLVLYVGSFGTEALPMFKSLFSNDDLLSFLPDAHILMVHSLGNLTPQDFHAFWPIISNKISELEAQNPTQAHKLKTLLLQTLNHLGPYAVDPSIRASVLTYVEDQDEEIKVLAMNVIANSVPSLRSEMIEKALKDQNEHVRQEGLLIAFQLNSEVEQAITRGLADSSPMLRFIALRLAIYSGHNVKQLFENALKDPSNEVKLGVLRELQPGGLLSHQKSLLTPLLNEYLVQSTDVQVKDAISKLLNQKS